MSKRSFLLSSFPVPSFLVMPAASIAVSDEALRFLELKKGEKSIELKHYIEKTLPTGTVSAGEIKKPSNLITALKEMKKEFNMKHVSLSLPEEKGYIYTTYITPEEEKITEDQVAFTLEKNVPFAVDEVIFDYVETGESNKAKKEVVVMVLPNALVQGYIDVLRQVDLIPLSFEIESYSLSRAIVNAEDPRTHLLVYIQKTATNISIISRNIPRFTSTLHSGFDSLPEDNPHKAALWLKEEVDKVRSYWLSHGSQNTGDPQTVIMCGERVGDGVEKEVISSGLDIEVNIANVWENISTFNDYVPDIPHSRSLRFGAAVGLALKEFKRKN